MPVKFIRLLARFFNMIADFLIMLLSPIPRKFNGIRIRLLLMRAGIVDRKCHILGGMPIIQIKHNGRFSFGRELILVNNQVCSTLGRPNKCKILVYDGAKLSFGDMVGISNSTIVATLSITIGNRVLIGGGSTIVDSDFHSLNANHWFTNDDFPNAVSRPISIGDDVLIGMNSIILKGVNIGNNVIVAAGSVVSRDIPDNQIWGGNPARFLKEHTQWT